MLTWIINDIIDAMFVILQVLLYYHFFSYFTIRLQDVTANISSVPDFSQIRVQLVRQIFFDTILRSFI